MAEMEETPQTQLEPTNSHDTQKNFSFRIWPPTQRTRDAVIQRLIETLSTPSILSKRYGTLTNEEASDIARCIEEEAFTFAGSSVSPDDDGIEILQVYSKEISKRMLDAVKSRSAATTSPEAESKPSESLANASESSAHTGETSSIETES
ncbi:MFP1 attachment factor 1 [Nicotiana tabacum]|uniref:MFP1 attachment factor 1 n=1 Tax=Nicotiana tabacum TaxID=4097 RepID=A0A1S4A4U2_TOBAC|nr:MFP1 attachment factor 1-like [Nicotiana tomentosiformis]XP_016471586.1 PREDICTED: MFP1 attachment factor 1-like [Nicotiana tabacum]